MIYEGTDRWNSASNLEHANHKYVMKIGEGKNAKYFYSMAEYAAYQRGTRNPNVGLSGKVRREGSKLINKGVNKIRGSAVGAVNKEKANIAAVRGENKANALRKRQAEALNRRPDKESARAAESKRYSEMAAKNKAKAIQGNQNSKTRQTAFTKANNDASTRSDRMRAAYQRKNAAAQKEREKEAMNNAAKASTALPQTGYAAETYRRKKDQAKFRKKMRRKYAIKNATTKAKNAASSTYNKAKKAYNSNQAKTARKKAKTTAKSAYNKGRSFVNKLFKK